MGLNWKSLLGTVAPVLARALGGPVAAAAPAIALVSRALLGHEKGTDDELAAAISGATPEQLEKLRAAEQEFSLQLFDRAVALERVEADDRADARKREVAVKDRMPAALAFILTAALISMLALLWFRAVPAENREPFLILLGSLSTAWMGAMSYYHGSSSGSRAKDAVLGRLTKG